VGGPKVSLTGQLPQWMWVWAPGVAISVIVAAVEIDIAAVAADSFHDQCFCCSR